MLDPSLQQVQVDFDSEQLNRPGEGTALQLISNQIMTVYGATANVDAVIQYRFLEDDRMQGLSITAPHLRRMHPSLSLLNHQ